MTRPHITMIISSLRAGGAERVAVTIANEFAKQMTVTILCLSAREPSFYKLSESVEVQYLGLLAPQQSILRAITANITRVKKLRQALRRLSPDMLVSFMLETNVLMTLSRFGLSVPLISCEHTDPRFVQHNLPWRLLRWGLYRFNDRVVVLNDYMQQWFDRISKGRVRVIPNPVQLTLENQTQLIEKVPVASLLDQPFVLAMGRLIPTKNMNQLINIYAGLVAEFPNWRLVIAGDGPQRTALQNQIDELGLTESVYLIGNTNCPHLWMAKAEVFASTSTLEAFPMAICEAMMSGLAVVATEYNESARHLITAEAGVLVSSGEECSKRFAYALAGLMRDAAQRERMGREASDTMEQFSVENVCRLWLSVFAELGVKPVSSGTGS